MKRQLEEKSKARAGEFDSDILKVDAEVVSLIARHIGPVYVPNVIVEELPKSFGIDALSQLGFEILTAPDEVRFEARRLRGQKGRHKLSENDCSRLLMASRLKYTCVSNDQELREACRVYGVPTLWELETVLQLYERGAFSYERAENYIVALPSSSPSPFSSSTICSSSTPDASASCF